MYLMILWYSVQTIKKKKKILTTLLTIVNTKNGGHVISWSEKKCASLLQNKESI